MIPTLLTLWVFAKVVLSMKEWNQGKLLPVLKKTEFSMILFISLLWPSLLQNSVQIWRAWIRQPHSCANKCCLKLLLPLWTLSHTSPYHHLFSVEAVTQHQLGDCWWTWLPSYCKFFMQTKMFPISLYWISWITNPRPPQIFLYCKVMSITDNMWENFNAILTWNFLPQSPPYLMTVHS